MNRLVLVGVLFTGCFSPNVVPCDGNRVSIESCRSCPGDCPTCTPVCGDFICDAGETCLGDCP